MIAVSYVFAQSNVDKNALTEEIKVVGDTQKHQAIAYARQLEAQLAAMLPPEEAVSPFATAEVADGTDWLK